MCCPKRGGSRGPRQSAQVYLTIGKSPNSHSGPARVAVSQLADKSLKFLKFMGCQAARAALALERLQAPSGGQIRKLGERGPQLLGGGAGVLNDLLALEEFLQRLAFLAVVEALDDLRGLVRGGFAQVVEQFAQ